MHSGSSVYWYLSKPLSHIVHVLFISLQLLSYIQDLDLVASINRCGITGNQNASGKVSSYKDTDRSLTKSKPFVTTVAGKWYESILLLSTSVNSLVAITAETRSGPQKIPKKAKPSVCLRLLARGGRAFFYNWGNARPTHGRGLSRPSHEGLAPALELTAFPVKITYAFPAWTKKPTSYLTWKISDASPVWISQNKRPSWREKYMWKP